MKCYHFNQMGHPAYRYLEKGSTAHGGDKRVNYVQEEPSSGRKKLGVPLELEEGKNLVMRGTLIKKAIKEEPIQKRSLFRVKFRIMGNICRVIIDLGSTNNIVSEETFDKLKIKRIPHSNPYKVTWLNIGQHILANEVKTTKRSTRNVAEV